MWRSWCAAVGLLAAAAGAARADDAKPPVCRDGAPAKNALQALGQNRDWILAKVCDAYARHGASLADTRAVWIVDLSRSSGGPRMMQLDTTTGEKRGRERFVAHGRGSDPDNDGRATVFAGPEATLLGAYRVGPEGVEPKSGRPFRPLVGLDGSNRGAEDRGVRIAGRTYVPASEDSAGIRRPGLSKGGFMVAASVIAEVVDGTPEGSLFVAVAVEDSTP